MSATMHVARLHGVGDIRVEQAPRPTPQADRELIRVTAVGLCGSDLHWYAEGGIGDARLGAPLVVGHEFAGVIEGGPLDGTRVAVDPAVPCAACDLCAGGHPNLCPDVVFAGHGAQDGALREYLTWPRARCHPLPDPLSDSDGAMLEPLGVAIHSVDLAHLAIGATVGVFGCGPLGLLLLQVARAAGATTVVATDPLPHRRAAADRLGADLVVEPPAGSPELESTVDVAFEVAGTDDAVHTAVSAVRPGGRVVLVGIPDDDRTSFTASIARRKGLSLVLVRRMKDVYARAISLVEGGRVDVASIVSHRYGLAEVDAAFAVATAREGLKVVVEPTRAGPA